MTSFFQNFTKKLRISQQIKRFSVQISRNFAGIAGNCGELPEHREFCSEFLKILIILTKCHTLKFAEILRKSSRWLEPMASSRRLEPADVAGFLRALTSFRLGAINQHGESAPSFRLRQVSHEDFESKTDDFRREYGPDMSTAFPLSSAERLNFGS